MTGSTARATVVSVLLHGALAVLVVLRVASQHASEPTHLTIINAELLLDGMTSAASGPATASTDVPDPEPQRGDQSPPIAAPVEPTERSANAGEPPRAAAPSEPQPAATAPPDPGRQAREPSPAEPSDEAPVAAAENVVPQSSTSPAPAAPETATAASTPQDAADPEPSPELAAAAPEPSAAPGIPIQGKQRQRLERRFAAWTGSLDQPERTVTWKDAGQEYTAVLRKVPAEGAMGMEHLVVAISTWQNGTQISTEMRMARLAFSSFAQFVDRWDPNVQIHDDQIDGRFHSNTEINVLTGRGASPKFNGKVTLAAHDINSDGFFSRARIFPEGVETGVRRIALPSRLVPLSADANIDDSQVQRFERDARITFYDDATFGWQYLDSTEAERRVPVDARAQYLIGADDVVLHVSGTVDGRVLVYTPSDIVIDDDLVYARDPRTDEDADDYLGLVAERAVEIAPPNVTGVGDLTVHASIYARRQFAVRNIYAKRNGTLRIFGSLAAGSLTATEPRYATKIEYDARLENERPPSFPLSDRYELEDWNGEWLADEAKQAHDAPTAADDDSDYVNDDGDEPTAADDDSDYVDGDAPADAGHELDAVNVPDGETPDDALQR